MVADEVTLAVPRLLIEGVVPVSVIAIGVNAKV
jgi:hypothetical protein